MPGPVTYPNGQSQEEYFKGLSAKMIDEEAGIPDEAKGQVKELVMEGLSAMDEAFKPFIELFNARLANLETTQKAQSDLVIQLGKKMEEFEIFAWEFKRDMLDSFIDNYTVLKASGGAVPDHYIPNLKSQSEQCSQALKELG